MEKDLGEILGALVKADGGGTISVSMGEDGDEREGESPLLEAQAAELRYAISNYDDGEQFQPGDFLVENPRISRIPKNERGKKVFLVRRRLDPNDPWDWELIKSCVDKTGGEIPDLILWLIDDGEKRVFLDSSKNFLRWEGKIPD